MQSIWKSFRSQQPRPTESLSQAPSYQRPTQDEVPSPFVLKHLGSLDLYEVTLSELQRLFSDKKLTSVEYVQFCLDRIHQVNQYLEAVIEVNPDALDIAYGLDTERQNGSVRGALHGVPVLVKDNMATKDRMQTTAGSWALLGSIVPRDAHTVSLLRKAGAVMIGHANMSEWASARSRTYSPGYSPRGGQARNPFNLSVTPFASSSGSAVAVSANIVPLSIGTETDGSIIGCALINGVVGIKPTVGLTSRAGVIPISETFDTVGPFGRTVADAAQGLNAIVGADDHDVFTLVLERRQEKDYSTCLATKDALKGAKFGVPSKGCWEFVAGDERAVAQRILDAMVKAGAEIVYVDFPCAEDRIRPDGIWDWEHGDPTKSQFTVAKVDAFNNINDYLKELSGTTIKTLEDVVAYNDANGGTEGAVAGEHAAFGSGQDLFREIISARGIKDATYEKARHHVQTMCRTHGIDAALQQTSEDGESFQLDGLLACDRRGVVGQIAAQAGYPIICIPIGLDSEGIPVALSIHQTAWEEGKLIRWASAIEDLVHEQFSWRPTPEYRMAHSKNIPVYKEDTWP